MPTLPGKETPGMRVLICAPERHILRLGQVNLERQKYIVTPTSTTAEAIESIERSLREQPFMLAFLDGDLPDGGVQAITEWIKSHEATQQIHIVVLDRNRNRSSNRMDGGDGNLPPPPAVYLTPPFNWSEIVKGWRR